MEQGKDELKSDMGALRTISLHVKNITVPFGFHELMWNMPTLQCAMWMPKFFYDMFSRFMVEDKRQTDADTYLHTDKSQPLRGLDRKIFVGTHLEFEFSAKTSYVGKIPSRSIRML